MAERELNLREAKFVSNLLAGLNQTEAYIAAGFSPKSASVGAAACMRRAVVSRAIEQARQVRDEATKLTAKEVIEGLRTVAARCMQAVPVTAFDFATRTMKQREIADNCPHCGGEITLGIWTFDAAGANRANELLGKHQALFTDKVAVEGSVEVKVMTIDV